MKSALILIDVQKGFYDPYWGQRNNPDFERNVEYLLNRWRKIKNPIFHLQHLSKEELSPLRPDRPGVDFMDFAKPLVNEPVFCKSVHSGFINTDLEEALRNLNLNHLILVGLTSDHCVSTTARMGADLGFKIEIPYDGVATFDRVNHKGIQFYADEIQAVSLASLHQEFARVTSIKSILEHFHSNIEKVNTDE